MLFDIAVSFFLWLEFYARNLIGIIFLIYIILFIIIILFILFCRGAAWEDAFLDAVGRADEEGVFSHISVSRFSSRTLDHELEKNTRTVVPYFSSTFIIMGFFSIVTCMMADWVRSKPWLGLLGNLSAAMATVAAFGACIYVGVEFIGINLAAPFLMIDR